MTGHILGPWRQWRRAGVAFALVALSTAVLAGVSLARDSPPPAGGSGGAPSALSPSSPPPTSAEPPQPTEPDPTERGPAPAFRCWSGEDVATLDECADPTGAAGLAWVFPSLELEACTDVLAGTPAPRLRQLYECKATAAGRHVSVTYVEWRSVADALNYFDDKSPRRLSIRGAHGRPLRFGWLYGTPAGEFTGALTYTDAPFGVVVRAPDAASRSAAGHDLIRLRPTAKLRGVPLRG